MNKCREQSGKPPPDRNASNVGGRSFTYSPVTSQPQDPQRASPHHKIPRIAFPENESDIEDDVLLTPSESDLPLNTSMTTRARLQKNTGAQMSPISGTQARLSRRTVKDEDGVDVYGNTFTSSTLAQGITGSLYDSNDGTTMWMRKTTGARNIDQEPMYSGPCSSPAASPGRYNNNQMSDDTWEDINQRYKVLCDKAEQDQHDCQSDCSARYSDVYSSPQNNSSARFKRNT